MILYTVIIVITVQLLLAIPYRKSVLSKNQYKKLEATSTKGLSAISSHPWNVVSYFITNCMAYNTRAFWNSIGGTKKIMKRRFFRINNWWAIGLQPNVQKVSNTHLFTCLISTIENFSFLFIIYSENLKKGPSLDHMSRINTQGKIRKFNRHSGRSLFSLRKQPFPDVLQRRCSWRFLNFRKTPVLKFLKACKFI